jgi:HD-GYP domain-containing protein (c-di-GMP phosphodiesterase class II)
VVEIVHQHHERLDGSGYPRRLSGGDILPEARILAVADVVEAMSSHRPYRPALGIEAAIAEISEKAGKLYDRDVAEACVEIFGQGFSFDKGIDPAIGCTFAERTFNAWEKA